MTRRVAAGAAGHALVRAAAAANAGNVRAVAGSPAARCAIVALKAIKVGSQPVSMVITPDGRKAFVANSNSPVVTPIRVATNTALRPVRVTTPRHGVNAIVAAPGGRRVYAAVTASTRGRLIGRAAPIRTATDRALRPAPAGHFPIAIAITPDGKTVYVLDWQPSAATERAIPIRTATGRALRPIRVGQLQTIDNLAVTPDGRTVYVPNYFWNTVTPIRTATNRALKPIKVGGGPSIAITPDGAMAYVTNLNSDAVTPIRIATNTALRPIKIRQSPYAIAITPDGRTVYAIDYTSIAGDGPGYVTPIRACASG